MKNEEIKIKEIIESIPIWKNTIKITSLDGGLTNQNFLINDGNEKIVVRLGEDILEHHILRSNEIISSKAAYDAGIGPKVILHGKGVLVLEYIKSKTLSAGEVRKNLGKIFCIFFLKSIFGHVRKSLGKIFFLRGIFDHVKKRL